VATLGTARGANSRVIAKHASCTLNGVLLQYEPEATLRVGLSPYEGGDQLRDLRTRYRETHFFRREKDGVASVALVPGLAPIGQRTEDRKLRTAVSLIAPLALDALMRYFHRLHRPLFGYKPLRMVSSKTTDQLLRSAIPQGVNVPPWIEQRVSYVLDTRPIFLDDTQTCVLLVCDTKTRNFISEPCSRLLDLKVPLEGRYVQVLGASEDSRMCPKPGLVGRVVETRRDSSGEILVLEDHVDGCATVRADAAFLEPRHENLAWCLQHLVPGEASGILNRLDALASQVNGGPGRLPRLRSMFDHLRSIDLALAPGLKFSIGAVLSQGKAERWFPQREVIKKPALVFSPLPGRTDTWNERGLDTHGPYDQRSFTPRRPRVAVVCQAQAQGQVEQFMRKFLEGMPEVSVGKTPPRQPYGRGFIRRFGLEGVDTTVFAVANKSATAYREACRAAITAAADRGFEWTLALVQIDDAFHLLDGDDNPYLVTKAVFMKQQVPVQEVTIEKMASPPSDLVYILNDISLAAYAKIGGTPWLLSAEAPVAHELVVGVGSHHMPGSRIGARERVVGITTVFTGDGRYLLESRSAAVSYSDYPQAILDTLERAVVQVRIDQNWQPNDSVRLIFHAFKPFKDTEVDAVKQLMRNLKLPHAQFAFVHVVDDHPFLVFDENNQGAYAPGGLKKGVLAPERGVALKLTRDEELVAFTGSREVKQPSDGMPKPALLRLHRDSTFKDITYLARQAFAFSCHSWRGFAPAPLPITILYSELIAKMLKSLERVSGWDADAMLGRIGRTRWFL